MKLTPDVLCEALPSTRGAPVSVLRPGATAGVPLPAAAGLYKASGDYGKCGSTMTTTQAMKQDQRTRLWTHQYLKYIFSTSAFIIEYLRYMVLYIFFMNNLFGFFDKQHNSFLLDLFSIHTVFNFINVPYVPEACILKTLNKNSLFLKTVTLFTTEPTDGCVDE